MNTAHTMGATGECTGAVEHKDAVLCSLGHLALTLFERFACLEVRHRKMHTFLECFNVHVNPR